ncbi:uncharacterized protein LOC134537215 [Bacillus rossius redtenbacheri]|uniref:uncharacterized protein LOC134537215 n=1 Tax=Bacillus rossius redtenbacheri TaxID=93214 RepID=UPI002FDE96F3
MASDTHCRLWITSQLPRALLPACLPPAPVTASRWRWEKVQRAVLHCSHLPRALLPACLPPAPVTASRWRWEKVQPAVVHCSHLPRALLPACLPPAPVTASRWRWEKVQRAVLHGSQLPWALLPACLPPAPDTASRWRWEKVQRAVLHGSQLPWALLPACLPPAPVTASHWRWEKVQRAVLHCSQLPRARLPACLLLAPARVTRRTSWSRGDAPCSSQLVPLGAGRRGHVWLVHSRGCSYALKQQEASAESARELRALRQVAGLPYANQLVRTYSRGGRQCLVLELCARGPLSDVLAREAPSLSRLAAELIVAVRQLHAAGLCHNDLHAGNILVRDDGHIALADLGSSSRLTERGAERDAYKVMLVLGEALGRVCPDTSGTSDLRSLLGRMERYLGACSRSSSVDHFLQSLQADRCFRTVDWEAVWTRRSDGPFRSSPARASV